MSASWGVVEEAIASTYCHRGTYITSALANEGKWFGATG